MQIMGVNRVNYLFPVCGRNTVTREIICLYSIWAHITLNKLECGVEIFPCSDFDRLGARAQRSKSSLEIREISALLYPSPACHQTSKPTGVRIARVFSLSREYGAPPLKKKNLTKVFILWYDKSQPIIVARSLRLANKPKAHIDSRLFVGLNSLPFKGQIMMILLI